MMRIEIRVSRLLKALAWMEEVGLLMCGHFHPALMKKC